MPGRVSTAPDQHGLSLSRPGPGKFKNILLGGFPIAKAPGIFGRPRPSIGGPGIGVVFQRASFLGQAAQAGLGQGAVSCSVQLRAPRVRAAEGSHGCCAAQLRLSGRLIAVEGTPSGSHTHGAARYFARGVVQTTAIFPQRDRHRRRMAPAAWLLPPAGNRYNPRPRGQRFTAADRRVTAASAGASDGGGFRSSSGMVVGASWRSRAATCLAPENSDLPAATGFRHRTRPHRYQGPPWPHCTFWGR